MTTSLRSLCEVGTFKQSCGITASEMVIITLYSLVGFAKKDQTVLGAADININDSFNICIMQSGLTSFTLYFFMLIIRLAFDMVDYLQRENWLCYLAKTDHTGEGLHAQILVWTQSFLL